MDGAVLSKQEARRVCGYVTQEDNHVTTCSVRELLGFAVELAVPADVSVEEKHRRVDMVIAELDLKHCCEVPIGQANDSTRQISGGERRRLSIAVELLKDPLSCVLF